MNRNFAIQTVVLVVLAALTTLGLTTRAGAVQGDKKIRLLDDCDPVTFNAVLGDGAEAQSGADLLRNVEVAVEPLIARHGRIDIETVERRVPGDAALAVRAVPVGVERGGRERS